MKIAVAGGSGVVGRHVIAAATRRGHEAVAVARSTGADVLTGAGLDEALAVAQELGAANPGGAYEIRPVGQLWPGSPGQAAS